MKKLSILVVLLCLALVLPSAAFGKAHKVEFQNDAVINGTTLDAGRYKMELNGDDEALFYDGKELVAKTKVRIEPIGDSTPNSISQMRDGRVVEIRLKDQKVIFVNS